MLLETSKYFLDRVVCLNVLHDVVDHDVPSDVILNLADGHRYKCASLV